VNGGSPIPFGPGRKDPSWRWGSFLVGVCAFVLLLWIATLGDIDFIAWWWWVALVLGILFSIRSGRAWARGVPEDVAPPRVVQPTVDVRGQAGSTYLLLEPAKAKSARVKPREFSPFWWALYSLLVRAPVHLGDYILTLGWRLTGGGGSPLGRRLQGERIDEFDHSDEFGAPDRRRF
jgi:hypothetical protein